MVTEVHQQGRFYRLSTGRAANYENMKPHFPLPEDWRVPQNIEGHEYLVVKPARKVNEKGTREKNVGNENMIMDYNEKIEVGSDKGSFAEEDWNEPEQTQVPKWTEPDMPMTTETRRGGRKKTNQRYNTYGDDFLIDKIQSDEIRADMVRIADLVADEEWQIVHDSEHSLQEEHTVPEKNLLVAGSRTE